MEETNIVCTLCQIQQATKVCVCVFPMPRICGNNCGTKHTLTGSNHFFLDVSALNYISHSNWIQYHNWLFTLKQSQETLKASLSLFRKYEEEIEAAYAQIQTVFAELKQEYLTALHELQKETEEMVNKAVEETTSQALNSQYEPGDMLTFMVWNRAKMYQIEDLKLYRTEIVGLDSEEARKVFRVKVVPEVEGVGGWKGRVEKGWREEIEEMRNNLVMESEQTLGWQSHYFEQERQTFYMERQTMQQRIKELESMMIQPKIEAPPQPLTTQLSEKKGGKMSVENARKEMQIREEPDVHEDIQRGKQCENCEKYRAIEYYRFFLFISHECFVCDLCYLEQYPINSTETCLKCRYQFDYTAKTHFDRLRSNPTDTDIKSIKCLCCNNPRKISKFLISQQLSHWWKCRMCDDCFVTESKLRHSCFKCAESYTEHDRVVLDCTFNSEQMNAALEKECKRCYQTRSDDKYSVLLRMNHLCEVCNDCVKTYNQGRSKEQCPQCKIALAYSASQDFELKSSTTEPLKNCSKCNRNLVPQEFSIKNMLNHLCSVCNSCLSQSTTDFHECPNCFLVYTEADQNRLKTAFPSKSSNRSRQCKKCRGKTDVGKFRCKNGCFCSACLLTWYLLTEAKSCRECGDPIRGTFPSNVKCSLCCRQIYPNNRGGDTRVWGICENKCILCCYCINLQPQGDVCRNCSAPVTYSGPPREELIELWNKAGNKGCYCNLDSNCTEVLDCSHAIHLSCKQSTYFCRLCSHPLLVRPFQSKLDSYL